MPKDLFMTKYLQGDKNATFIIYVANSKQIPSAIGKKEIISSDRKQNGGMFPRNFFILTPLKCREMHSKLINEILKYKLSVLEKRYRLTKWCSPLKN